MGRQRSRAGQHLYVCLAGLIIIFCGCAHGRPGAREQAPYEKEQAVSMPRLPDGDRWQHLQPVRTQIENRDFEGAFRAYQQILSLPSEERQADLVLFDLGLLCCHYANPKKNFNRSLEYFTRLVREHPGSPLLEEAKIWVNLLETLESTKRVDIELEERTKALNK